MTPLAIIPGIGNSGPEHWQTRWQADSDARRLEPGDWNDPSLPDWIAALDRLVAGFDTIPLLVAHSLGCLLVAHWVQAGGGGKGVAGALLVAPPDPTGPTFPVQASSFANPPLVRLPFPALIVASSDDPYGDVDHADRLAAAWGAELRMAGALGHLNSASGLGDWPWGRELLTWFDKR